MKLTSVEMAIVGNAPSSGDNDLVPLIEYDHGGEPAQCFISLALPAAAPALHYPAPGGGGGGGQGGWVVGADFHIVFQQRSPWLHRLLTLDRAVESGAS